MSKIERVKDVNELLSKWKRLSALSEEQDKETLLQLFLTCLKRGAIFLAYGDKGLMGSACVEWCGNGNTLRLHSLPSDQSVGFGKLCLEKIKAWAVEQGADHIEVTSNRLSGCTYRYFEKSLGFRRSSISFVLKLQP